MYKLTFKRQAIKALRKMSAREALHIRRELDELAESPDRRDSDVRPLRGRSGFRLRIGEMRIIFEETTMPASSTCCESLRAVRLTGDRRAP